MTSGLRIDEYALQGPPNSEPLTFVPLEGSQEVILDQHEKERSDIYLIGSFIANRHYSISVDFGDQELVARKVINDYYNLSPQITVEVLLDNNVIFLRARW